MDKHDCVLIVGHHDVMDCSLVTHLREEGYTKVYSSAEIGLNTTIQASVNEFFQKQRPQYIFLGSVRSGGIEANQKFCGDFHYENVMSQNNVVAAAKNFGIQKLLYYASSCIYPKETAQPMNEDAILTGPLERTSENYAMAKLAGVALMRSYRRQYQFNAITAIPATVYGPESDTDMEHAHVLGALIARFSKAMAEDAQEITLWGSGNPRREFMYAKDFVDASLFLMKHYDEDDVINMGVGTDITIRDLAKHIAQEVGFQGEIHFDTTKSDGAMQKLLNNQRIEKLGWKAKVHFADGLKETVKWYQDNNK